MTSSTTKQAGSQSFAKSLLCLVSASLMTLLGIAGPLGAEELPETVVDVLIEGNETIPSSVILQKILTQPGRPISNRQLREDKRNLMNTRWFYSVSERFDTTPKGDVLIFQVHERPIVRRVQFRGVTSSRRLKELASWTGLKVGSPFDHIANREAVHRIEQEYKEKGYFFVKVELERGGQPTDREVIFRIHEGKVVRVQRRSVQFAGNNQQNGGQLSWMLERQSQDGSFGLSPSAARLKTKLVTKEAVLGFFGGLYKPESMEQDVTALKQYYRGLGFFDIAITAEPLFSQDRSSVEIRYTVNEGIPYKVRNIEVNGNNVIATNRLRLEPALRKGQYFNSLNLSKDVRSMMEQYGDRGHYFANVTPVPKFTEQPGIVDISFEIDEDRPRYVRYVNGQLLGDNPHTMEIVLKNHLQLEPGDKANPKLVSRGRSRLSGSGLFEPNIVVDVVPVDQDQMMQVSNSRTIRGQGESGYSPAWTGLFHEQSTAPAYGHSILGGTTNAEGRTSAPATPTVAPNTAPTKEQPASQIQTANQATAPAVSFIRQSDTPRVVEFTACSPTKLFYEPQSELLTSSFPAGTEDALTIRGQSPDGNFYSAQPGRGNPVLDGSPYNNQFQALPPGWVDVNVSATEGRTGRLMFGAGVNSDAGIVGSFVWDERNFNLFRPPTSFADIIEGRAWRGGGQKFRLEAAPGDTVSRYAVSWTDPYFMYSDYSLSVSGFYFNRFYPDWDETRLGGRVSLGRQITPEWSVNAALRLEDVEINNPRAVTGGTTSVPELEAVRGGNFLSTVRGSVSHDTRDSSLMPSDGHFYDLAFEQAFGDFNYPRWEGEARQYFTMYNRADGSGRHVLTLAGNMGWSGNDTPVFERYYAGGFQSFRGFAFRGVTPRGADNISTGGTFQMLGTAEYRIPLTADDMVNMVVFSDVGSVEQDVRLDDFRVTVGVGLRVVVPAMGPVPLAFDFGFPVKSQKFDDERIFSFYVGINR
ncbi:MAG: BamA/TamA family outer membrane protein [Fuerstiella sp.]